MTPEILARVSAARTVRDLSDLARQTLGAIAEDSTPAERIDQARRLRLLAVEYVDRIVLAEALGGTGWEDLAAALGRRDPDTVEADYADDVAEWSAATDAGSVLDGYEALDAWYDRHREDHDPQTSTPVRNLLAGD
ncbi:hypothetical protein EV284_6351 [Streptomyces sp. BK022]|uniref:hypothetical protein n=1 Tax=Streptomyces sp. BK022 TaxID=2512123 RepID=UPI001029196D|nr:hypothetical protein [Streptomyces sp. BK022]RZU28185.1 hypothetical protein EV284_6351 [Streptomyces sp. BK022]